MRFASLGSGSRGNALLVESGTTRLLVDCGFSTREACARLERLGIAGDDISAVLVTHEHNDHAGGVGPLARRFGATVWMTPGTFAACRDTDLPRIELFNSHEPFAVGDLEVWPYPVPHDAREPTQFVFSDGALRLGLLTDAGRPTQHIEQQLGELDALVLECNHDEQMLAEGPYPPRLKARVGGDLGHLSNDQAGALLARLAQGGLQHVVGAHLSEKNNRPELARLALGEALGCSDDWISLADQERGFGWREIA